MIVQISTSPRLLISWTEVQRGNWKIRELKPSMIPRNLGKNWCF